MLQFHDRRGSGAARGGTETDQSVERTVADERHHHVGNTKNAESDTRQVVGDEIVGEETEIDHRRADADPQNAVQGPDIAFEFQAKHPRQILRNETRSTLTVAAKTPCSSGSVSALSIVGGRMCATTKCCLKPFDSINIAGGWTGGQVTNFPRNNNTLTGRV